MPTIKWTVEKLHQLVHLYRAGATLHRISQELHLSKAAVHKKIGQLRSIGQLNARHQQLSAFIRHRYLPPSKTCCWIDGEGANRVWCGAPTQAGSSFCPHHHSIVWIKPPKLKETIGYVLCDTAEDGFGYDPD